MKGVLLKEEELDKECGKGGSDRRKGRSKDREV